MKISTTRITAVLVLAAQWLSAAAMIIASGIATSRFSDFQTCLPAITIIAIQLTHAALLISIAALTTIIVILAECLLKSERPRFVIQIVNLCLWLVFAAFVLAALMIPLAGGPVVY